jgi:beta-fructofuranosidase
MSLADQVDRTLGDDSEVQRYRELRAELDAADRFRPRYHFSPPGGILHDPNGALYRNGQYHLFYQFWPPDVPEDREWSEAMHWGHAVSEDLFHWHDLPIALAPGPERSCYSGQAIVEDDRAVAMYFGPGAGNCIATSEDPLLVEWSKHPDNPVIDDDDFDHRVFDPEIWTEGEYYYAISGTKEGEWLEDSRPVAFCYRSKDLSEWELVGRFLDDDRFADPGEDAAVPNFLSFDQRYVLLCFSHRRGAYYYVGEYDRETHVFDPLRHDRLTHGPATHSGNIGGLNAGTLHAPSVLDDGDRQIAFFNVMAGREPDSGRQPDTVMSLPRRITLDGDHLAATPIEEVESLRQASHVVEPGAIPCSGERVLEQNGTELEVEATIELAPETQTVTLRLFRAPDGDAAVDVTYYPTTDALALDTASSATGAAGNVRQPEIAPLRLEDDTLHLRAFVDRSVVEVFAHGQSLTARAYPEVGSDGIALRARGADARVLEATVHRIGETPYNRQ